jgi:hypothetical protein
MRLRTSGLSRVSPLASSCLVQGLGHDIQQEDLQSRIGEMSGDGGPHDSGTEHGYFMYLPHIRSPFNTFDFLTFG